MKNYFAEFLRDTLQLYLSIIPIHYRYFKIKLLLI